MMLGLSMAIRVPGVSFQKRVYAVVKRKRSRDHFRSVSVKTMYLPRAFCSLSAASTVDVVSDVVDLWASLCDNGEDLEAIMARTTKSLSHSGGRV